MMNEESKRPVTIEDLLRVKRAEKPTAESWAAFERELRAKQLAALVEKRPWWRRLPERMGGLARLHLPIGATAVLAITLVSVRTYQPVVAVHTPEAAVAVSSTPSASPAAVVAAEPVQEAAPAPIVLSSEATSPGELARMVPLLTSVDASAEAAARPSARSIAENRAVAEAMFGAPQSGFEARALPVVSVKREPLAHMPNPAETTRRSRIAAAFAAAAVNTPAQTASAARTARRISDEELYDSVRRFGASGNTVSFKF